MFSKDYCLYRNGAEQTEFIVYTQQERHYENFVKVLQRSFYAYVFLSLFWINTLHSVVRSDVMMR